MTDTIIKIDTKAAQKRIDDAERIDIFQIDDDVYSIPKVARAELTLNYLDVVSTRGEEAGAAFLIIEMFGQEAFDALRNVVGLSDEELKGVQDKVLSIVAPKSSPKGRGV